MKVVFINILLVCILSVITGIVRGQSPGSEETLIGFFAIAPGGTTASVSESLYIGPGTYEIEGTWEIYSKNVVIDPAAVISGNGTIRLFNPSVAGGAASPTFIDGNGSNNPIEVNLVHNNAQGILLSNIDFPTDLVNAGFSNNSGSATTYIGRDLSLAVDGSDITLGIDVTGDLVFDPDATISNYRPERMIITNNSILSHVVKEGADAGFVFPVGIEDGDYTPAQIIGSGTIYVSVQDYSASTSDETLLQGGPERTWHVYGETPGTALLAFQHNISTDQPLFDSNDPHFVTQFNGTSWSATTEESALPGTLTTGAIIADASLKDRNAVSLPSSSGDNSSYFTKTNTKALPVELISFHVTEQEGGAVFLEWRTANEVNSSYFDIERSTDARAWVSIGQIRSAGESSIEQAYYFNDADPADGTNYYRLKMVDLDMSISYSHMQSINFGNFQARFLYPNPATDRIKINKSAGLQNVKILSLQGRTVKEVTITNNQYDLSLNDVPAGIYLLEASYSTGEINVWKFTKL